MTRTFEKRSPTPNGLVRIREFNGLKMRSGVRLQNKPKAAPMWVTGYNSLPSQDAVNKEIAFLLKNGFKHVR